MNVSHGSLICKINKVFLFVFLIILFPNLFFAQYTRSISEINNKDNLRKAAFNRIDLNNHESYLGRAGKKTQFYAFDGKIDSIINESENSFSKTIFTYDSVKTMKNFYYEYGSSVPTSEKTIICNLHNNNKLFEFYTKGSYKTTKKYFYNDFQQLTLEYAIVNGNVTSIQKKEYSKDSLMSLWMKCKIKEKIEEDESVYSEVFLNDLEFDTIGLYEHSFINDTLITYQYKKGILRTIHKEFKDSTIYFSKFTDIDSDSSYTHYFEIETDTVSEYRIITFDKKDDKFIPFEVTHRISTPHYKSNIVNAYGGLIEPKNEKIVYRYSYDQRGNWNLKEAFIDDLIIFREIRTFEYY